MTSMTRSAKIRAQLDHPIIDADGHWLEPVPIFLDFLQQDLAYVCFLKMNMIKVHQTIFFSLHLTKEFQMHLTFQNNTHLLNKSANNLLVIEFYKFY